MYWTDWGTTPKIETAYMSGSQRRTLVSGNLRWPNGISIDFAAKKLYWTDAGKDRIERCNLDGTSREVTCLTHQFIFLRFLSNLLQALLPPRGFGPEIQTRGDNHTSPHMCICTVYV